MANISLYLMLVTLACLPCIILGSKSHGHSRYQPAVVPLQGYKITHANTLSEPVEQGPHFTAESGYMGDCVKGFDLNITSERGLDSDAIYNNPEHAKMIDHLLSGNTQHNNQGEPEHHPDLTSIYQRLEYNASEIERLDYKKNVTKYDFLLAIKTSCMSLATMAGIMAVRDLALEPGHQENAEEGKSAGQKFGHMVSELMANAIKRHIEQFEETRHKYTLTHLKESAEQFDALKLLESKEGKTRRRRHLTGLPYRLQRASYLPGDVDQDLSVATAESSSFADLEEDSDLSDDRKSLAKMVYQGYSASHGNRFGRDVSSEQETAVPITEAAEETSTEAPSTEEQSTTPKPKKKIVRKKIIVKHQKATTTTTTTTGAPQLSSTSDSVEDLITTTSTPVSSDEDQQLSTTEIPSPVTTQADFDELGESRADTPKVVAAPSKSTAKPAAVKVNSGAATTVLPSKAPLQAALSTAIPSKLPLKAAVTTGAPSKVPLKAAVATATPSKTPLMATVTTVTTAAPSRTPLKATVTTAAPPKKPVVAVTTAKPIPNTTPKPTINPQNDYGPNAPTERHAWIVFKISSIAGYVTGIQLALSSLSQARTNIRGKSKYLDASELGFRDVLERGWKIGMEKSYDDEANKSWSKLKNSYNESTIFDEERPDPYDLGARLGYMIGTVVGYNTARKPDPTLDGTSGSLEKVMRPLKTTKFSVETLQTLASKRAAYSAASSAAFKAALKVGFLTGAKLGPKAGIYYVQRSGARSGAKIGATLGAEAGLRAGGDTTARVAFHEQSQLVSMVSPSVTQLGTTVAMNCGRDSGRVVGAIVGALAAAEGFKAYVDNSGFIEAVAGDYIRFRTGAEHGYKLGESSGLEIKINKKSPFYIDPLKKINLNTTPITQDLPELTDDMLKNMKNLHNMTVDQSNNEISGEMVDSNGKSLNAKLKLRVYPSDRKTDNILFKIVGKPLNNSNGNEHLDHIYGFLAGSLTDDDPSMSSGDSRLDHEDKALKVLYDEAQRGIMPSSKNNLKMLTSDVAAQSTGREPLKNDTATDKKRPGFTGSIFESESDKNDTQSVITKTDVTTGKPVAMQDLPTTSTPVTVKTSSETPKADKNKKKKKKPAGSTKAPS